MKVGLGFRVWGLGFRVQGGLRQAGTEPASQFKESKKDANRERLPDSAKLILQDRRPLRAHPVTWGFQNRSTSSGVPLIRISIWGILGVPLLGKISAWVPEIGVLLQCIPREGYPSFHKPHTWVP